MMAAQKTTYTPGPGPGNGPGNDGPFTDAAPVNLGNINRGAALEAFAHELAAVLDNIADLATPATSARSITLKVDFKPNADRVKVATSFACTSKLAAVETYPGEMFIAKTEGGGFVALDADPRQMPLWPTPRPMENRTIEFKGAGDK